MDPTLFGPGSFMGKLMGLLGRQGQGDERATAQNPGFLSKIGSAINGQQPAAPAFGSMSAPLEGGGNVPLPPTRPNPGQDLQTAGGQQPLGLLNSDPKMRAAGANQIVNALGGIPSSNQLKPAQFAPLPPQQGAGPMQLPPMNLGGM